MLLLGASVLVLLSAPGFILKCWYCSISECLLLSKSMVASVGDASTLNAFFKKKTHLTHFQSRSFNPFMLSMHDLFNCSLSGTHLTKRKRQAEIPQWQPDKASDAAVAHAQLQLAMQSRQTGQPQWPTQIQQKTSSSPDFKSFPMQAANVFFFQPICLSTSLLILSLEPG